MKPVAVLKVRFYRTVDAKEPVREWLTEMGRPNKTIIGTDIKTVQIGWPLGMPLVRKLDKDLWEVRVRLPDGIARILFTAAGHRMVLLHGFIKKSQKTPRADLELANTRLRMLR